MLKDGGIVVLINRRFLKKQYFILFDSNRLESTLYFVFKNLQWPKLNGRTLLICPAFRQAGYEILTRCN